MSITSRKTVLRRAGELCRAAEPHGHFGSGGTCVRHLAEAQRQLAGPDGVCRVCGCTDEAACAGGCSWAEPGLCSQCDLVAFVGALEELEAS